jgi:hypothetical protein
MKHILRKPIAEGFSYAGGMVGTLRLSHRGSDTEFDLPLTIDADGVGETTWTAPQGAPMGDYDISVVSKDRTIYHQPVVQGRRVPIADDARDDRRAEGGGGTAQEVPLDLFVGYLSGGGAGGCPCASAAAFEPQRRRAQGLGGYLRRRATWSRAYGAAERRRRDDREAAAARTDAADLAVAARAPQRRRSTCRWRWTTSPT